jgi:hypothetical protein
LGFKLIQEFGGILRISSSEKKENNSIFISVGKKYTDLDNKMESIKYSAFNRADWQKRSGIQDVFVRYGQYFS